MHSLKWKGVGKSSNFSLVLQRKTKWNNASVEGATVDVVFQHGSGLLTTSWHRKELSSNCFCNVMWVYFQTRVKCNPSMVAGASHTITGHSLYPDATCLSAAPTDHFLFCCGCPFPTSAGMKKCHHTPYITTPKLSISIPVFSHPGWRAKRCLRKEKEGRAGVMDKNNKEP